MNKKYGILFGVVSLFVVVLLLVLGGKPGNSINSISLEGDPSKFDRYGNITLTFEDVLDENDLSSFVFNSSPTFTFEKTVEGNMVVITPTFGLRDEQSYKLSANYITKGKVTSGVSANLTVLDQSVKGVFLRSLPISKPGFTIIQTSDFEIYVNITSSSYSKARDSASRLLTSKGVTPKEFSISFSSQQKDDLSDDHIAH